MKINITLTAILLSLISWGQSSWATYFSVEENIHISDVRPSYNYLNLSTPAANAGIRLGAFYTHNSTLSGEITLGVVGLGTPGTFSNTIVPVEVIGHYNVIAGQDIKALSKFNLDLGAGSGLAESSNGNFGFAEHFVVGASAEFANALPFGTLIMGARYTGFMDDYIDGRTVSGTSNDGALRFYTAFRFKNESRLLKEKLNSAEEISMMLSKTLQTAENNISNLEKQIKSNSKQFSDEKKQLQEQIESFKITSFETKQKHSSLTNNSIQGTAIVIGSFANKSLAQKYRDEIGEDAFIMEEPSINRYRVIYKVYPSISQAKKESEALKEKFKNLWLVKY